SKAPIGILPGSLMYDADGKFRGTKTFKPQPNADQMAAVTVRGYDNRDHTYSAYEYELNDRTAEESRGEAYEAATGRLISRSYDWVRLRLSNVHPMRAGMETIYYDPALPFELSLRGVGEFDDARHNTHITKETKVLLTTTFSMDKQDVVETQRWREYEPLA